MHRTAALAIAALLTAGGARADDCATVMEAGLKSLRVPSKTTSVTSGVHLMPATSVIITVDGKRYAATRSNQHWIMTRFDAVAAERAYRESFAGSGNACKAAGSETISGEATDIFESEYRNGAGERVQERIWISRARGLPVREEASVVGHFTTVTTMDYNDIHAPEGLPLSPPDTDFPDDGGAPTGAQGYRP